MYIDKYGNVILSQYYREVIKDIDLHRGDRVDVYIFNNNVNRVRAYVIESFSDIAKDTLVLYENSFGFIEIAVNQGSAKDILNIHEDCLIKICKSSSQT